ncbi:MAG TPA: hypothetical protein VK618_01650 [Flavitalea sp.]|nr:hypothetical protein [Flavitalea sp.]
MHPAPIPISYKDFAGTLTTGHQAPTAYVVMRGNRVQGQFNLMLDGWHYYPNDKGYRDDGFEPYLIELVTEGIAKNPGTEQ